MMYPKGVNCNFNGASVMSGCQGDQILKLRVTSFVLQKDNLLVCSINPIIESRIDAFEIMKKQLGKNYKCLLDNIKEEDGEVI